MQEQYKKNSSYSSGFSSHNSVHFAHKALQDTFFFFFLSYLILVLCCLLALVFRQQWKQVLFLTIKAAFRELCQCGHHHLLLYTPQHYLQQGPAPRGAKCILESKEEMQCRGEYKEISLTLSWECYKINPKL